MRPLWGAIRVRYKAAALNTALVVEAAYGFAAQVAGGVSAGSVEHEKTQLVRRP